MAKKNPKSPSEETPWAAIHERAKAGGGRLRHFEAVNYHHNSLVIERPIEPGNRLKQYRANIVNSIKFEFNQVDVRLIPELMDRIGRLILELDERELPPHDPGVVKAVEHDARYGRVIE